MTLVVEITTSDHAWHFRSSEVGANSLNYSATSQIDSFCFVSKKI